jgi:hypothetical protein
MGKGKGTRRGRFIQTFAGSSLIEFYGSRSYKIAHWFRLLCIRSTLKLIFLSQVKNYSMSFRSSHTRSFNINFNKHRLVQERFFILDNFIRVSQIYKKSRHAFLFLLFYSIYNKYFFSHKQFRTQLILKKAFILNKKKLFIVNNYRFFLNFYKYSRFTKKNKVYVIKKEKIRKKYFLHFLTNLVYMQRRLSASLKFKFKMRLDSSLVSSFIFNVFFLRRLKNLKFKFTFLKKKYKINIHFIAPYILQRYNYNFFKTLKKKKLLKNKLSKLLN